MTQEMGTTRKALQTAIQMEIDGKEFYLKASETSHNELGKNLLRKLADEEDLHRQKFEEIYQSISSQKSWPKTDFKSDGGQELRTIFARATDEMEPILDTLPNELDAVETAMAMENRSYDFYKGHSKTATYDMERDFYEALAAQESEHHRILLDYYEFLKNPAAWFVQKEHPSLDGS